MGFGSSKEFKFLNGIIVQVLNGQPWVIDIKKFNIAYYCDNSLYGCKVLPVVHFCAKTYSYIYAHLKTTIQGMLC